jgi:predicted DNA-binding transcriptional regulator AlpA
MSSHDFPGTDPVLTLQQCAQELGMSRPTFWRSALPYLETVQTSPQRRGVRRSVLEQFKRDRTRPAARQLPVWTPEDIRRAGET